MRTVCVVTRRRLRLATALALVVLLAASELRAAAQSVESPTREESIAAEQVKKLTTLRPFVPGTSERVMNVLEQFIERPLHWHPFFASAYRGGGLALGLGYKQFVSSYDFVDLRGSFTPSGYKRVEAEFVAPRLFDRRGRLSLLGGWRDATQVGYFGTGNATTYDDRTNYSFRRPYASALLTVQPTRRLLMLQGGVEWTEWRQRPGDGTYPSVDTRYTSGALPGLGASPSYIHSQGTVAFDWRTSSGYSRRGGYYGVTFHDYTDSDSQYGFQQVDYEATQHVPIYRETWALSLHGKVSTTSTKNGQEIPFFMLPALGGGTDLRGFDSWRFRDRDSLLLQAEWRIMANRFLDTALFYDTGKVAGRTADLNFHDLKNDYGFGVRFHGPLGTPVRIDIARSNEKTALVITSSAAF